MTVSEAVALALIEFGVQQEQSGDIGSDAAQAFAVLGDLLGVLVEPAEHGRIMHDVDRVVCCRLNELDGAA